MNERPLNRITPQGIMAKLDRQRMTDAVRAMGIEPNDCTRIVIDIRGDGSVFVHTTLVANGRDAEGLHSLLDAVAELDTEVVHK